jgi:hypothetical protein
MDVILKSGNGPTIGTELVVDPSFSAARYSVKPDEFVNSGRIGGHFYLAATFSNTAGSPAAGSAIFAARWADSNFKFVLKRVAVSAGCTTVFTAAQILDCDIIAARSWTASPTGGTTISPSGYSQKARSSQMSGTLFASSGALMISSGTALTVANATLDTQPFGYAIVGNGSKTDVLASYGPPVPLYSMIDVGQHPIVFDSNEGFVIRNGIALGAAGVVKYGILMEWAELPAY